MYVGSRNELGAFSPGGRKCVYMPPRQLGVVPIVPIVAAAAQAVPLLKGKVHYSPWGFMYDEYPRKIYDMEVTIRTITKEPLPPDPGGGAKPTGGPAYQASMLNIVPRYVPGSESQIAAYDRRLNEAGGAYEVTFQRQQSKLAQLRGAAPAPMPPQSPTAAVPVSPQPIQTPAMPVPQQITVTPRVYSPYDTPPQAPQEDGGMLPLLAIGALALFALM